MILFVTVVAVVILVHPVVVVNHPLKVYPVLLVVARVQTAVL